VTLRPLQVRQLPHSFISPQLVTKSQDTEETALYRPFKDLLRDKKSKLRTTKNEIAKIGKEPSYGRLEALQVTQIRLEKEREVLDWTYQLYNIAHGPKKPEEGDNPTRDELLTAIADSKVKKEIAADVWKVVDPVLEQLWTDLGNKEPYYGSNKTHSTGYDVGK
jgi:hypothetical protein